QRGAARGISRALERTHFRVGAAGPEVIAGRDALPRAEDDRADPRVRVGGSNPPPGNSDRPSHGPLLGRRRLILFGLAVAGLGARNRSQAHNKKPPQADTRGARSAQGRTFPTCATILLPSRL